MNQWQLASRWRRLCATVIDVVLVPTLTIFLVMVTGVVEDAEDYINNLWMLWVLLLAVLSYLLLNGYGLWRNGQTLGKRMFGIQIIDATKNEAGDYIGTKAPLWKLICIRALFFPLLFITPIPWLGLLPLVDQILVFSKPRRCLHDWAAGTVVVDVPQNSRQR